MNDNIIKKQTEALEGLYNFFNDKLFDGRLPSIALTIQSKGRKNAYGWCTLGQVWEKKEVNEDTKNIYNFYEINLSAEFMDRGIYEITETLLHEMVHLSNICKGIKDCNPKTQNHNTKFKEEAERIGLVVEKVDKRGWSSTSLSEILKNDIDSFIDANCISPNDIFNVARVNPNAENKPKREAKPKITYLCKACGIQFKSTKNLNIVCGNCDEDFEKIEE